MNIFCLFCVLVSSTNNSISSLYNLLTNNEILYEICEDTAYYVKNSEFININTSDEKNHYALISIKSNQIELKTSFKSFKTIKFDNLWSINNYSFELSLLIADLTTKLCNENLPAKTEIYVDVFSNEQFHRINESRKEKEDFFITLLKKNTIHSFYNLTSLLKRVSSPHYQKIFFSGKDKNFIFPLPSSFEIVDNLIYKEKGLRLISNEIFSSKNFNEKMKISKYFDGFVIYMILMISNENQYAVDFCSGLLNNGMVYSKCYNGLITSILIYLLNDPGYDNYFKTSWTFKKTLKKELKKLSLKLQTKDELISYLLEIMSNYEIYQKKTYKFEETENLSKALIDNEFSSKTFCNQKLVEYLALLLDSVHSRYKFYFKLCSEIDRKISFDELMAESGHLLLKYDKKMYRSDVAFINEKMKKLTYTESNKIESERSLMEFLNEVYKNE
ncbi:uncharacterized protein VNE69_03059 [Vairimorpha necatrix]|uniref:Uncharacterized protein n=1 Tax=Vairimorpha necatrix TaxID=6039 RepID=A0AAX4JA51_9MICR